MSKLTIKEAVAQGFIVDTCCYPPMAYKGPRFQPTEHVLCFTDLEAKLLVAVEILLDVTYAPDRNCSCHISPPCNDCVDYSGIREAEQIGRGAVAAARGKA